jgi:hypothetical protein
MQLHLPCLLLNTVESRWLSKTTSFELEDSVIFIDSVVLYNLVFTMSHLYTVPKAFSASETFEGLQ